MKLSDSLKTVWVQDVDLSDTRFEIRSRDEDLSSLAISIQKYGLLSPPVLWPVNECFIVVSGFQRIRALCRNQIRETDCFLLENADETECAVRAVAENAFQRELTLVETIKGVKLLNRFMTPDQVAEDSLQIFNCRINAPYIRDLLALENTDFRMTGLLDKGQVCLKAGLKISQFPSPLSGLFLDLFSRIKASASKQMEMISWTVEIMARENLSPLNFFQETGVQEILNRDTKDLGFKAELLRQFLANRRYPHLEKKRTQVKQNLQRLNLGKGVRYVLPENFEGTNYSLTIDFKNLGEFKKRLADLASLEKNPVLPLILDREGI